MNKKNIAAGAVVVALAAYGGATWYLGGEIQKHYESALADAQTELGTRALLKHSYDRGFLTSHAHASLQWLPEGASAQAALPADAPAAAPLPQLVVDSTMRHGPLAGLHLAAAVVENRFSLEGLDASTQQMLSKASAPTMTSVHHLSGTQEVMLSLPSGEVGTVDGGVQRLHWETMAARMTISADRQNISGNLQWPAAQLSGVSPGDLNARGEVKEDTDQPAGGEPASGAPNVLDPANGRYTVAMKGMDGTFDVQLQDGLWILAPGTGRARIDQITVTRSNGAAETAIPKTVVNLQGLTYAAVIKRTGDTLGWTTDVQGKGDMGELKFDALGYQEVVGNIDVQAVMALQKTLVTSYKSAPPDAPSLDAARSNAFLKELGPRFVDAKPSYNMKLSATLEGEQGHLEYGAQIQKAPSEQMVQAIGWGPALVTASSLHAAVEVPNTWLPRIAMMVTGKPMAPEQISALVGMVTAQGYVVQQGQRLSTQVRFDGGQLTLNGKPIAVPALGR